MLKSCIAEIQETAGNYSRNMNTVVNNHMGSCPFTTSQNFFGGINRAYGNPSAGNTTMCQRPSFAIQELLGLTAGSAPGVHHTAHHPQSITASPLLGPDPSGGAYGYQNTPTYQHSAGITPGDCGELSSMQAMYNSAWRTAGFLQHFGAHKEEISPPPRNISFNDSLQSLEKQSFHPVSPLGEIHV